MTISKLPPRGSPWTAVLFLVPFCVMLVAHRVLGLSDALMVATPPGERAANEYNLAMVVTLLLGQYAAAHHILMPTQRSWPWVFAKLLPLGWIAALGFASL